MSGLCRNGTAVSFFNLPERGRAHLRGIVRERMADLTPSERAYVRGLIREHLASRSLREREDLSRIERERFNRHGPYGRQ